MSEANTKTYHKRLSDSGLMRDGYMVREKKTPSRNDRCFVNIPQKIDIDSIAASSGKDSSREL